MRPLSLAEACELTGGRLGGGADPAAPVLGASIDTRALAPGELFVALRGEQADGHAFAAQAAAAGASAVLAEREVPAPHLLVADATTALGQIAAAHLARLRDCCPLTVVALTGSVGKTTTKDLLARLLGELGPAIAPPGSFNNQWGVPMTILRAGASTRFLVLEMGANHVGEIAQLTAIAPPDLAMVLGVGIAHVGEFGSIEAIARAKAEIVEGEKDGAITILNAANAPACAMAARAKGPVAYFGPAAQGGGLGPGPLLSYSDVSLDEDGHVSLTVTWDGLGGPGWPATRIDSALVGEHNAANIAAACAAAACLGLDGAGAAAALSGAGALSPHRLAITDRGDGVRIVDDSYNANPQSMAAALRELARYRAQGRRTVAVIGEMKELGERTESEHIAIGQLIATLGIEQLIACGAGAFPAASAARAANAATTVAEVPGIDEAATLVEGLLRPGDVVLLKGSKSSGVWRLADALTGAA